MSLKVIKIHGMIESTTADTTLITADNSTVTVDITNSGYTLKVPYRFWATSVNLILWNELIEVETVISCVPIEENNQMKLEFDYVFIDGTTFETKIESVDGKLIWRGKILATTQTDLQNFTLNRTSSNIIKI